jgi:hypothetical protein
VTDQRPIGFWLKLVDQLLDERFAAILEEHGVSRGQWQLLNVVSRGWATEEAIERAVAPFTTDGAPASAQLEELIESDWVQRGDDGYRLTERGSLAHLRLSEVVGNLRAGATDGVPSDDYDRTLVTLERIARNLGWAEQ